MSIWGLPKTGKSHLALTWPGPIAAIEIGETGIEDLLYKFLDKEVRYLPLALGTLRPEISDHEKLLRQFEKTLDEVIASDARTLIIDSTSRLWRTIRVVMNELSFKENERKKQNRADYEKANDYFEEIVQRVRTNRNLNLVLLHRHRELYAMVPNDSGVSTLQATGQVEARDYRGIDNLVSVIIQTQEGMVFDARTREQVPALLHKIELCRPDRSLNGTVIRDMDYTKLMERIYGKVVE